MGWEDRGYAQDGGFGGGGERGGRFSGASVCKWMLIVNIAVFVIDSIMAGGLRTNNTPWLTAIGYFSVEKALMQFQIWRVFTYQFLHADFFHILFNMIGLFFFGPLIERWWGSKRFLAFYLLCGVSGAVVASLLGSIPGFIPFSYQSALVGASGSLFGILAGAAMLFPNMRVMLLIPPVPMSMRVMALIFLGIAALNVLVAGSNAGGDAAHLGGALLGAVLVRYPNVLNWADRVSPSAIQDGVNKGRYERKVKQEQAAEDELDQLLDKVSSQGLHSLSNKEKKRLNQLSEKKRKDG